MSEATSTPTLPATHGHGHGHADDPEHIRQMQKRFLIVYGVLIVGTILTVSMYYVYFEEMWQTVSVAMLIASVKGLFVAIVFMHLWHDHRNLGTILLYTGVVAVGLFALTIGSFLSVVGPQYLVR